MWILFNVFYFLLKLAHDVVESLYMDPPDGKRCCVGWERGGGEVSALP